MTNISKTHMEAIDRLWWSPQERATGVMGIINSVRDELKELGLPEDERPSDLDIFCFAVEYIAQQSLIINDEHLTLIAVALSQWMYTRHYTEAANLYGPPDKLKAEKKAKKEAKENEAVHPEGREEDEVQGGDGRRGVPRSVEDHEGAPTTDELRREYRISDDPRPSSDSETD